MNATHGAMSLIADRAIGTKVAVGLDSLAGAIEQLTVPGNIVALVSHRSSSKISAAQKHLVAQLRSRFGANRVLNVPIRANPKSDVSNEPTHRTRSFLFAAL